MPWACPCVSQPEPAPRRPKIDRSMIGQPTNFQHTGHIGSGSLAGNSQTLPAAQSQMSSKGGHLDNPSAGVSHSLVTSAVPIVKAKETEGQGSESPSDHGASGADVAETESI
eukprot:m.71384 g.71384  ORF g.71384 m.71384 type:complete len:112 (+) comp18624_c0_seq1:175-510(+)